MDRFDVAKQMIQRAGEVLRRCHLEHTEISQKTGHQDLVTFWDRKIERQLRQSILTAFPEDSIVGEEYPSEKNCGGRVTWYLDPIDGTTNFINQHRNYAVSVGCWEGATPCFGMVLDVERQELYWARYGAGAWLNQSPIHVSQCRKVEELLLTTPGIRYTFLEQHPHQRRLIEMAKRVRAVRCMGSVALELCEVAAGRADVFIAMRSSPWDHNAARIILEEAGGAIFTMEGANLPLYQKSTVLGLNSADLKEKILMG